MFRCSIGGKSTIDKWSTHREIYTCYEELELYELITLGIILYISTFCKQNSSCFDNKTASIM